MEGVLVQVNVSRGGVPKLPLLTATVTPHGVEGDRHADARYHGGPLQAVCLFEAERLDELAAEGYRVGPGSFGENFTTRGIDYREVRLGDAYRIGDGPLVQITKPRVPCTTIQVYGEAIIKRLWGPTVPWGESGFYARVLEPGTVRPGDVVALERAGETPPPAFTRKVSLSV